MKTFLFPRFGHFCRLDTATLESKVLAGLGITQQIITCLRLEDKMPCECIVTHQFIRRNSTIGQCTVFILSQIGCPSSTSLIFVRDVIFNIILALEYIIRRGRTTGRGQTVYTKSMCLQGIGDIKQTRAIVRPGTVDTERPHVHTIAITQILSVGQKLHNKVGQVTLPVYTRLNFRHFSGI